MHVAVAAHPPGGRHAVGQLPEQLLVQTRQLRLLGGRERGQHALELTGPPRKDRLATIA
jgi:hypothetical protein